MQFIEYLKTPFAFFDTIYGSTFFILTGFHGLHVIVGFLFLLAGLNRINPFFNSYNFPRNAFYYKSYRNRKKTGCPVTGGVK